MSEFDDLEDEQDREEAEREQLRDWYWGDPVELVEALDADLPDFTIEILQEVINNRLSRIPGIIDQWIEQIVDRKI